MVSKNIHTPEGIIWEIRAARMFYDILREFETRLILIKDATDDYGCPVDDNLKPYKIGEIKRRRPKKREITLQEVLEKSRGMGYNSGEYVKSRP